MDTDEQLTHSSATIADQLSSQKAAKTLNDNNVGRYQRRRFLSRADSFRDDQVTNRPSVASATTVTQTAVQSV